MSQIKLTPGATGAGVFTIASPTTGTDRTLTLPDNTGTVVSTGSTAGVSQAMLAAGVAGNGPAFSAIKNATQTVTTNTATKVTFQTEVFDTNNNFASSTFTPTVAGYYQINGCLSSQESTGTTSRTIIYIFKNGSVYRRGGDISGTGFAVSIADVVSLNGSTDYVEIYVLLSNTGTPIVTNSENTTFFSGSLVRSA